jgi:two-component system, chemotaxis family, chemotaxis protein CheY
MKTCLIVDDSSIIRTMAKMFVEKLGFVALEADDGLKAQTMLKTQVPDLMIVDWNMPNIDGLTLVKWVREELQAVEKPLIILCSGDKSIENIQQAILAGANEYIVKPFNHEIIKNKFELLGLM